MSPGHFPLSSAIWVELTSIAQVAEVRVRREDNHIREQLLLNQSRIDSGVTDVGHHFLHTFYLEHEKKAKKEQDIFLNQMTSQRQS